MPELRDANLLHGVAATLQSLLQCLVGTALAQPLQEALLAVGHVKKVLSVRGDQDEAELRAWLQVGDVSVKKPSGVELRQANGCPAFALAKGRGGTDQVEDQVQVYVVQKLVLFPHQSHQLVSSQQDGKHQVLGFGCLQARRDHVPNGAGQREAGDSADQEARVPVQTVQEVVSEILGAGQQATQVVVLLVLEDVVELCECEQANDLVVDVLQLSQHLLVRLTGLGDPHQDQRALGEENDFTAI